MMDSGDSSSENRFVLSGLGPKDLQVYLQEMIREADLGVVGIASAFVSVAGVSYVLGALGRRRHPECCLIAGTDLAITHPEALRIAEESGWHVKLASKRGAVFHPKLVVTGMRYSNQGAVDDPRAAYIGSGNLTRAGLTRNVECGLFTHDRSQVALAAATFGELWRRLPSMDDVALRNYSERFAKVNRHRSLDELNSLGVGDVDETPEGTAQPSGRPMRTISAEYAYGVWAELKSFTGEYALQVEFPKAAASMLRAILAERITGNGRVPILCEDGQTREMTSRFYSDNSMHRLNVPNGVPGVIQVRTEQAGIACVEKNETGNPPARLSIIRPGSKMDEVVGRSFALGTWGSTSTRRFGWY
jgi:HKD family nuclease